MVQRRRRAMVVQKNQKQPAYQHAGSATYHHVYPEKNTDNTFLF